MYSLHIEKQPFNIIQRNALNENFKRTVRYLGYFIHEYKRYDVGDIDWTQLVYLLHDFI